MWSTVLITAAVGIAFVPCLAEGACNCYYPTYKPDPNNPSNYIICDNCIEVTLTCPNCLVWNNKTQSCDWPANKDCGGGGGGGGSGGGGENGGGGEATATPGTSESVSCGECESGTYSQVEDEPCKYKVCGNGCWTTMKCPSSLIWDQEGKTCKWQACENCGCTT